MILNELYDRSPGAYQDGQVGTALIQEYRFNQYCKRLQRLIMQKLDDEFKMFLRWRGFNIDASLFNITFCEPQNFASYRQSQLDTGRIGSFIQLEQLPYMSKRFMMKRFLGLTEEELVENEYMWREENDEPELQVDPGQQMRGANITPAGIESDLETGQELAGGEAGVPGAEGAVTPPTEIAGQPAGQGAPAAPGM